VAKFKHLEMTLRNQNCTFFAHRIEHRLKFLRKIPGPKREIVTGGSRKLHKEEF
jgi:hypothetical protein